MPPLGRGRERLRAGLFARRAGAPRRRPFVVITFDGAVRFHADVRRPGRSVALDDARDVVPRLTGARRRGAEAAPGPPSGRLEVLRRARPAMRGGPSRQFCGARSHLRRAGAHCGRFERGSRCRGARRPAARQRESGRAGPARALARVIESGRPRGRRRRVRARVVIRAARRLGPPRRGLHLSLDGRTSGSADRRPALGRGGRLLANARAGSATERGILGRLAERVAAGASHDSSDLVGA